MGCCTTISIEHEVENLTVSSKSDNSANASFVDLSIGSNYDIPPCAQFLSTDELNFTQKSRLRSTSCNSLRQSQSIENAFLMSAPLKTDRTVSSSCNLKNSLEHVNSFVCLHKEFDM